MQTHADKISVNRFTTDRTPTGFPILILVPLESEPYGR
jgi:hypothetical protein